MKTRPGVLAGSTRLCHGNFYENQAFSVNPQLNRHVQQISTSSDLIRVAEFDAKIRCDVKCEKALQTLICVNFHAITE